MKFTLEHQKNNLEKEPVIFSDIEFNNENEPQKFVSMTGHNSKDVFMASYPASSEIRLHMHTLMHFVEKYKGVYRVTPRGGGIIRKVGDTFFISGTSTQLGHFDKDIVSQVLNNNYPESKIIFEE